MTYVLLFAVLAAWFVSGVLIGWVANDTWHDGDFIDTEGEHTG